MRFLRGYYPLRLGWLWIWLFWDMKDWREPWEPDRRLQEAIQFGPFFFDWNDPTARKRR